MKNIFALTLFLALSLITSFYAYGKDSNTEIKTEDMKENDVSDKKVMVVYFSCTNTTKGIAEKIVQCTNADSWRIQPQEPYTSADLDYNISDCRANREQNDESARPTIKGKVENMADYDIIFLGYPIWWGIAPKIIYTFLESYDLSGKTIVPFCTSGSSDVGASDSNLHGLAPKAEWKPGKRFASNTNVETIKNWVENNL